MNREITDIEFDKKMLWKAVHLSESCIPSEHAYSVGAVIADRERNIISTGYSRETSETVHAEEVAINKAISSGIILEGSTIYSSLEPCGLRLSGNECCVDKIIRVKIQRVVFSFKEPSLFVNPSGMTKLMENGIKVDIIDVMNSQIKMVNRHLLMK